MRTEQPTVLYHCRNQGRGWARKTNLSPPITDRLKAVVLLWFYVACFWCQRFGDVSPYECSVWVEEWPPFGKYLFSRLTICSLCFLTICNKRIKHSFPCKTFTKPECDNVLQPDPRSDEGCNTLIHEGFANVNTRKRL